MKKNFHFGILGHPLGHTLSPVLHQFFLKSLHLEGTYEKLDVSPENLVPWLQNLQNSVLKGFNVTIPYKVLIMPYLQGISQESTIIGAVNTVSIQQDGLYGENTDISGFINSLSPKVQQTLEGSHVLILGAGGASRAIAYGLLKMHVGQISFWSRNPDRAQPTLKAIQHASQSLLDQTIPIHYHPQLTPELIARLKAIINTPPVGMSPESDNSPLPLSYLDHLPQNTLVYDLIYNPIETKLLQSARQKGLQTQDGITMLVHQGAKSFEIWTGQSIRAETIEAAKQELCNAL